MNPFRQRGSSSMSYFSILIDKNEKSSFSKTDNPFSQSETDRDGPNPFGDDVDATDVDEDELMSHAESTAPRYQWDLDRDVSDFVDFTPIHKSLHIHSLLG